MKQRITGRLLTIQQALPKAATALLLVAALAALQGCSSPPALGTVTTQNRQNIESLTQNVELLLALYEPMVQKNGEALLIQRIGKVVQELTAVVGASSRSGPVADTWDAVFQSPASSTAKRDNYLQRYNYVKSVVGVLSTSSLSAPTAMPNNANLSGSTGIAVSPGISPVAETQPQNVETERLKQREGWIFSAVTDPNFTPKYAHDLIKALKEIKQQQGVTGYYTVAEARLVNIDPKLAYIKKQQSNAQLLLSALKQEVGNQLSYADSHSKVLLDYTGSSTNLNAAVRNIDPSVIDGTLARLGDRYIKDPDQRSSALDLMRGGITMFRNGS